MSFSEKYLDLLTECDQELIQEHEYQFFGVPAPWTDEAAEKIVEEYTHDYCLSYEYSDEDIDLEFEFGNGCLFRDEFLDKDLNPDNFILKCFKYELREVTNKEEVLQKVFKAAKEDGKINLFAAMYVTAVREKIFYRYLKQYADLKKKYPPLPIYPPFITRSPLTEREYYEASTC